jgi:hypothetical protein
MVIIIFTASPTLPYKTKQMNNFLKRTILMTIAGFISASLFAQTSEPPKGWHMLDRSSGYYGISVDKAYDFVKSKKVKQLLLQSLTPALIRPMKTLKRSYGITPMRSRVMGLTMTRMAMWMMCTDGIFWVAVTVKM